MVTSNKRPSTDQNVADIEEPDQTPLERVYMPLNFLVSNRTMELRTTNGSWHGPSGYVHTSETGDLVLFDVRNGTTTMLLPVSYESANVRSAIISEDGRYLVQEHSYSERTGYRQRYLSRYSNTELHAHGTPRLIDYSMGRLGLIDTVAFGPMGSQMAFVQMYNIYYKRSARLEEPSRPLTFDGSAKRTHGLCNWAYERDICAPGVPAMWFSPDGDRLAYLTFDDQFVMAHKVFDMEPMGRMYDTGKMYPVPMAGLTGTRVKLTVANLMYAGQPSLVVPVPAGLQNVPTNEAVVAAVHWTKDRRLVSVWLNRQQNVAFVQTCTSQMTCETVSS